MTNLTHSPGLDGYVDARCVWRMRVDFTSPAAGSFEFDLRDVIELGTNPDSVESINLIPYCGKIAGVSRRHVRLESSYDAVSITDLDSTNGTRVNDLPLVPNILHDLADGDHVSLGNLQFVVHLNRIDSDWAIMEQRMDLASALMVMAKVITSQVTLDEMLSAALEIAISQTSARAGAIWLVDPKTRELVLEAERGLGNKLIRQKRLSIAASQARQALAAWGPFRVGGGHDEQAKLNTNDVVEAVLYAPLVLGTERFGVMSVIHSRVDKVFSFRDETVLGTIADFLAIPLNNSLLARRAAEVDQMKHDMIQNVSHEFRTPLTSILGYCGLALEDSRLPDKLRENVDIIRQQASKMSQMVANFVSIDLADTDTDHRKLTDLSGLIDDVIKMNSTLANDKSLVFRALTEQSLPLVFINDLAIMQVLDNLVCNAIKFTPEGGQVMIHAAVSPQKDEVIIAVSDTGIGIAPEELGRIFEKFYQVDGSSTRRFGGVGLGLSASKEIIEAHSGRIWAKSAPDSGTTMFFTLPCAP